MNELINIKTFEGIQVTSSREVAENFGKRHSHVCDIIRNLTAENSEVKKMIIETTYEHRGNIYREYLLTRDGFSLLVMGFTGSKALEWKLKYIQAFNKMEQKLISINKQETLKKDLIFSIYKGGVESLEAHKKLIELETAPLQNKIALLEPKAKQWNIYLDTHGLTSIDDFSKTLGVKGFGRNNIYKWLRENKYLKSDNLPYAQYVNSQQLFVIKSNGYHYERGVRVNDVKTFLTAKGVEYFIKKFMALDLIECREIKIA